MGFASTYLKERALFPELIRESPLKDTGIIVVVPAYNEPGISGLLDSLALCEGPDCKAEVIVVINAPGEASAGSLENNKLTVKNIESWKNENRSCFFRLYTVVADSAGIGKWGVGLARKTGMDEAARRFNSINNPEGIILNLDADCQVEKNYFVSVSNEFLNRKDLTACSIFFEHPLSGSDFSGNIYRYIALYELHLRYYLRALSYAGFPYIFHTVGSAIGVRAISYVKAGGMNRRQAGEDFYFIQKLVPAGGFFNLKSTTVYPSPRPSFRVPFGTGASIGKLSADNSPTFYTYNLLAFKELHCFFGQTESIYENEAGDYHELYNSLPQGLKSILDEKELVLKLTEIKNNTSSLSSFKKRFFGWFNMFRIVKYLNFVHSGIFEKQPVTGAGNELLELTGIYFRSDDPVDLLRFYRSLERKD